jgi:hypothetical protein
MNFPMIQKALRAELHCGGGVKCRRSDPPQAENPALQDSYSYKKSILTILKHFSESFQTLTRYNMFSNQKQIFIKLLGAFL